MKNKVTKLIIMFALLFGVVTTVVLAAPVDGEIIEVDNNGYNITVKVWGDDFYTHVETLGGYTLVRDPETNYICYAISDDNGDIVSSKIIYTGRGSKEEKNFERTHVKNVRESAGRINQKVKRNKELMNNTIESSYDISVLHTIQQASMAFAPAPSEYYNAYYAGSIKGLTVLIDFPDVRGTITQSQVDNFCNNLTYTDFGNNGSVRKYFSDISGGNLDYTNAVTVYYTAQHNKSYYTDPSKPIGQRATELIKEALNYFESKSFDFNQLSKDKYGRVRALNVFYAGGITNLWSEGLWPHQWTLGSYKVGSTYFGEYQITNIGTSLTIGTFCHENGHLICDWADTYDYTYTSYGCGKYDLMSSSGGTNPVPPNPYFRNILAGWGEPAILNNLTGGSTVSVNANQVAAQIYRRNNNKEFYVIENVQATGRWSGFGTSGLYIWHADKDKNDNDHKDMTYALHYQVSLEQADGQFHLEKNVNNGNSRRWVSSSEMQLNLLIIQCLIQIGGMELVHGLRITNISAASSIMTYTYGKPVITGSIEVEEAEIYVIEETGAINWGDVSTYRDITSNYGDLRLGEANYVIIETESNGEFEFEVSAGQYTILIDKPGYLDYIITNVQIGAESIDLDEIELIPGDMNKDGVVDGLDIAMVKNASVEAIFMIPSVLAHMDVYDINGDGVIDILDILEVIKSASEERVRTIL